MADKRILLLGATGHVGSAILLKALAAGYSVTAAVRSADRAGALLAQPALASYTDRLDAAIVPDGTVAGSLDTAVRGCSYIINAGGPLPFGPAASRPAEELGPYFVGATVAATKELLAAALRAQTVKRVVFTSSTAALMPLGVTVGAQKTDTVFQPTDRNPDPWPSDGVYANGFQAYAAAKIAGVRAAEQWVAQHGGEENAPAVVFVHPGYVIGPKRFASSLPDLIHSANVSVLGALTGVQRPRPTGLSCHIDDVADVHIAALEAPASAAKPTDYLVAAEIQWEAAYEIAARRFSEAVAAGTLAGKEANPAPPTVRVCIDSSAAEGLLGRPLRTFEEQVVDVVAYYLEAAAQEKAETS